MGYATITKSNITYQPRENIKTLIQANLTNPSIQIYSRFPNIKAPSFKGFPFIVLMDSSTDEMQDYMGTSVYEHINEILGEVYHDATKMSDNQHRTIKQNIVQSIMLPANQDTLSGYGQKDVYVMFDDEGSRDYEIVHQMQLYRNGFRIPFRLEVSYA